MQRFLEAVHAALRTEEVREKFDAIHEAGRAFVEDAWDVVVDVGRAFKDCAKAFYGVGALDEKQIRARDEHDEQMREDIRRLETHRAENQMRPPKRDSQERLAALAELHDDLDELSDEELEELDRIDAQLDHWPWATPGGGTLVAPRRPVTPDRESGAPTAGAHRDQPPR